MIEPIQITIPGPAKGKGRPQFSRKGGVAFTPKKTRIQEAFVRGLAAEAMNGRPAIEGPVSMCVNVWVGVAKSWPNKRKKLALSGFSLPIGRPDLDNLIKLLGDALNGVVFRDDSQIVYLTSRKRYSTDQKTVITIEEIAPAQELVG